jgi:hypothetical protein
MAADITDGRALGGNLRLQLSSLFQAQGETSPGKNLGLCSIIASIDCFITGLRGGAIL